MRQGRHKCRLRDLRINDTAVVAGYEQGCGRHRHRLLSMGLTKGTPIRVSKMAPLGDPVEIEVRGFKLSLRKNESDQLILETEDE